MNSRERLLAIVVGLLVGYFSIEWFVVNRIQKPLKEKRAQKLDLQHQVLEANQQALNARQAEFELNQWRKRALSGNANLAANEYDTYLHRLLDECKIDKPKISPATPSRASRQAQFQTIQSTISGQCDLARLSKLLYRFYHDGYLHQMRVLTVNPLIDGDRITGYDVHLNVEALSLSGAEAITGLPEITDDVRPPLLPQAEYRHFASRNLFQPTRLELRRPPAVVQAAKQDDRSSVYFRGTVVKDGVAVIWLKNTKTNQMLKISEGESFEIPGMEAKVVEANLRRAVLQVDGKQGEIRSGSNLSDWKELANTADSG